MAAPAVHQKTGNCSNPACNKPFTPQSMVLCIRERKNGFILRRKVCCVCYEAHYGAGE